MIVSADRCTLGRWRYLSRQSSTLLRALENEVILAIVLHGRTLDVGGGRHFDYVTRVNASGPWHAVNITSDVSPTFVADLETGVPILSNSYDNVVSFNTLEHLQQDGIVLSEIIRVLKPGGRFHLTVPFLYRKHGRYGDFHRHSADSWEAHLTSLGLPNDAFTIRPLVWSPLTSALAQFPWFAGGVRGCWLRGAIMLGGLARRSADHHRESFALGFYITGTKPQVHQ